MTDMTMDELKEIYGEPISVYTREQAIEDGVLVDVTEWGSADKGFIGGYTCSVVMTRALWNKVEAPKGSRQDTRGRAHDVLSLSSFALRAAMRRDSNDAWFKVKVGNRNLRLRVTANGEGITIGFPEDF